MREIFDFALLALAAYRVTRLVTTDHWPPIVKVREWCVRKAGMQWGELFVCPFCMGFWISWLMIGLAEQFMSIRYPVLQALAVSSIVGLIGKKD